MGGLTLQNLPGLWLLSGLLPIVLLYVLKARRRRVRVPSTWLWAAARRDLQARSPFKRLRRELPLLLEIFALTMLALALARPACRGRSIAGAHVALVIDLSASMGARNAGGPARIEEARAAARRIVEALAMGSEAMLIGSGRDARVLAPLGRDRTSLIRAIERATAQDVEGDLGAAVALAVDRLRPLAGERRVIVVTDGASARLESLRAGVIPIELVRVGRPVDNAAIVRMDVRTARQGGSNEVVQAFALLANFGETPREVYVTARREGESSVFASRRLRLDAGRREPVTLTFPFTAEDVGRGVLIELEPRDALPTDDVAYGRIPPGLQLPVVLASRSMSVWVQRALESDPNVRLSVVTPDTLGELPPGALVVLEGACPDPLPTRHDVLVFAPPQGPCADVTVGSAVEAPAISSYVHTDARFRFLTMDGVHLARATPLRLGTHAQELLRAGEHVLMADISTPERSVTVVGLDVNESDWPLRASFVLFVRNVEEIARAHRARTISGGGRTGEPLRIAVPPFVREVDVRGPGGAQRVPVTSGIAIVGETSRAGLYRLAWQGGTMVAPVNLLSDAESNLRAAPLRIEGSAEARDVGALVKPHEDLAPWVAALAASALLANLFWLTRRERAPSRVLRPARDGAKAGTP